MSEVEVQITNRLGLHARAAARFVQTAAGFEAKITAGRDGRVMDGKSILGILLIFAGGQLALTVIDLKDRKGLYVALMMLGITLAVAHLNHGLRGRAAEDDARFVRPTGVVGEAVYGLAVARGGDYRLRLHVAGPSPAEADRWVGADGGIRSVPGGVSRIAPQRPTAHTSSPSRLIRKRPFSWRTR